jgi:hypothetical protein
MHLQWSYINTIKLLKQLSRNFYTSYENSYVMASTWNLQSSDDDDEDDNDDMMMMNITHRI